MSNILRIAIAQLNLTVGDIKGNVAKILAAYDKAEKNKADLIVYSEMTITGYPPEDLVLRPHFQQSAMDAVKTLAEYTKGKHCAMLVGGILCTKHQLYNAAFLVEEGEVQNTACKYSLPNYGVFDEKRVFSLGPVPRPIEFRGNKLGVLICEDMWDPKLAVTLARQGADMLVSLNASPFEKDKQELRYKLVLRNVMQTNLPLIYVNQVGGQDELVFEGHSFIINNSENLMGSSLPVVTLPAWQEEVAITSWKKNGKSWQCADVMAEGDLTPPSDNTLESIYQALIMGVKDYVTKNNFPGVIIGLSGGIDSALSAAIAVDALGADKVHTVMMPSLFTSKASHDDAELCAKNLGIQFDVTPINTAFDKLKEELKPTLGDKLKGVPEENMQSRLRGLILMAISNATGSMVLTTGNKSELAVGYATLYGDMCGGFNILKDIYKTQVYALSYWRNENHPKNALGPKGKVIPDAILTKAPTAELRENQKDSDSLPPYDILDDILEKMIEHRMSSDAIIANGHGEHTVRKVAKMVYSAEYKRRQSPPGVKVTGLSFGKDRRYPITNKFEG